MAFECPTTTSSSSLLSVTYLWISAAMQLLSSVLFALSALTFALASAPKGVTARQAPNNLVVIDSPNSYCLIVPLSPHTDIGDSEHPGGMTTYCSASARSSPQQGLIPDGFWRNVDHRSGTGKNGGRYTQLTGCIRPELVDRLNPADAGGQYDSSGGAGGRGNPAGSKCIGYNHYVELIEPRGPRACIRCCDDAADCPVIHDTQGCPNVISGNYLGC